MTDDDYANNQVTTVMSVTELPRLGGQKADTDFLTVKDFLTWQEIFNQKMALDVDITIANRTNRARSTTDWSIIQKGEMDNWLETGDYR